MVSHLASKIANRLFKRPAIGWTVSKRNNFRGDDRQIINEVNVLKHDLGGKRFILGADCTILPKTPMDNVRAAIQTSHHTHE